MGMHYFFKIFFVIILTLCACRRSVHRPGNEQLPEITTCWSDNPTEQFKLRNSHLEPAIFTIYNEDYFLQNQLPEIIPSRHDPKKKYDSKDIIIDLEAAVSQLMNTNKKIKKLEKFTILKQTDYNYLKHTGLIILRHKQYPFVVKLFMESPDNFVKPFNRGIEECAFFIMGGGMNRYLAGFTRIPNRNEINKKINSNRYWNNLIDTPRKWFWLPKNYQTIDIMGKNIGNKPHFMRLPAMYALICDAIETDYAFTIFRQNDREVAISIAQFLGICIDPHINNFIVEKESKKIIIIDTEHFPTLIGIKDDFKINDFFTYYSRLIFKFMSKKLTYDKQARIELQTHPKPPVLLYTL